MKFTLMKDNQGIFECAGKKFPAIGLEWDSFNMGGKNVYFRNILVPLGESGLKMSIVWGTGSYSSNRHTFKSDEPTTVEAALLDIEGKFVWSDVKGYLTEDDLCREIIEAFSGGTKELSP